MVGKKTRFRCDKIFDIVRCAVLCESMAQSVATLRAIHATPPDAENPPFTIDAINDTWSSPTADGWAGVTLNGHMRDDTNHHKCEIAIIHKALMMVREELGGDAFFTECRGYREAIEVNFNVFKRHAKLDLHEMVDLNATVKN